jgi:antirestriction protein
MSDIEPRVWVGCLACYNDGRLVGEWLDAADGPEWKCERVDLNGPHEEFWVMDHEGFLGALSGECSPHEAAEIAEALASFDGPAEYLAAFLGQAWLTPTYTIQDAVRDAGDAGFGEYESLADYAYEFAESCGTLPPEQYAVYVDWEAMGRDMASDGYTTRLDNGNLLVWFS